MNAAREIVVGKSNIQVGIYRIIGTRQYQQDAVYMDVNDECVLAAVCDGMGGMEGGELASNLSIKVLGTAFRSIDKETPIPDFYRRQAENMNVHVSSLTNKKGKKMNSGTTIVSVIIKDGQLYWLSVGDSRIYVLRNGILHQVNREHNYRMLLVDQLKKGTITKEQFDKEEKSRQAEALISYLGIGRLELMEINKVPFPMADGDIVLLCSDGLYKSLSDDQIKAMIQDNHFNMGIASDRLCEMALHMGRGSQDNTSVILLKYQSL